MQRRDTHIGGDVYTMAELRREFWEKTKKGDMIEEAGRHWHLDGGKGTISLLALSCAFLRLNILSRMLELRHNQAFQWNLISLSQHACTS